MRTDDMVVESGEYRSPDEFGHCALEALMRLWYDGI